MPVNAQLVLAIDTNWFGQVFSKLFTPVEFTMELVDSGFALSLDNAA